MKKLLFALPLMAILFFSSCTEKEEVDPNIAGQIEGTYSISEYTYFDGVSTSSSTTLGTTSNIAIVRESDTEVKITLTSTAVNVLNDADSDVIVSETTGGNYSFSRSYGNLEVSGTVVGDVVTFKYVYTDGKTLTVTASK